MGAADGAEHRADGRDPVEIEFAVPVDRDGDARHTPIIADGDSQRALAYLAGGNFGTAEGC